MMGYVQDLGATTSDQQRVLQLQAQINRFASPPIALTGQIDEATAYGAVGIIVQRFTAAFVQDPANRVTSTFVAEANRHWADAVPWVRGNIGEITDVIRDFANFTGKPPARGDSSGPSGRTVALLVLGALGLVILSKRGGRRGRR